jgi:glycosyltransferase-like protein
VTDERVVLVTYSTKPRGGVVHTLALAEALQATGLPVRVVALGDPEVGFFRDVAVPSLVVPGPDGEASLEDKVARSIDLLAEALAGADEPVLHAQDCIAARAAARVRDAGGPPTVVRTVHHVDDFSSDVLMECQRAAILEPDVVLVVSEMWQRILLADYGVHAEVVPNGVDLARFSGAGRERADQLRASVGAAHRPLLLAVGGVEPRKGSDTLMAALAGMKSTRSDPPVLAVLGGHSFQDHRAYRDRVIGSLGELSLELDKDVVLLGTVPDDDVPAWYAAADALAFPSVKEGFGLAVLEALSAGTPVVTSDLPVFREYLVHGHDALLVRVGDAPGLQSALSAVLDDAVLRAGLVRAGTRTAARFTWTRSAVRHRELYRSMVGRSSVGGSHAAW